MLGLIRFFTIERQLMLFGASLVAMVLFHYWWGFAGSWLPFLIVLFLVVKYFLVGTVNAAAMKMQFGDWEGADKLLNYTKKPEWLRFGYHSMYYVLKSRMALQNKDLPEAEKLTNKALTLDPQDDFKAMMYLQLMHIYGQRKNQAKVKEYYQKAKKLNVTQPEIAENIRSVGEMMKGQHPLQKKMMGKKNARSMMSQGYMKRGRGNKRR